MNKLLGKIAAGLMAIALIITGSCLFGANSSEVLAADTTAFHTEQMDVSSYIDTDGNRTAPKPTASGYEDWIFAGWYRDAACTTAVNSTSGTRYAKFVPSEVLSVKCQVTAGTTKEETQTSSLRLISTVDSLNYNEVGFEVSFGFGAESLEIPTYNVFKKIESAVEGQEYGYSPNIFDLQSEYFVTATLTNIDDENFDDSFYIRPYWQTLDGTKVYGVSRCARVEDSYLNIVNVPVRLYSDASVTGGSVSVAYNTTNFTYYGYDNPADLGTVAVDGATSGTVKVTKSDDTAITADGMFVNLRLQRNVVESNLPKKNQFTVTSNLTVADGKTVVVPNVMYTHYHTTYNGTPDTSWYQNGVLKYVITSPAELYGVASLAEKTNFYDVEIYLGADIKINDGTVADWKAKEPTYKWEKTIGSSSLAFNGTFDGQGHTISGIYLNSSAQYLGLFGLAQKDATIRDFKLVNSYFKSTTATWVRLGSIVGDMRGKSIDSVYSSAILEAQNTQIGGLVGAANAADVAVNMTNCQFDGELTQTIPTEAANQYIGGLAGIVVQGTVNFTDCLNTGKVNCVYTTANTSANNGLAVGGLLGGFMNNPNITFTNCLNSGEVMTYNGATKVSDQNGVGSVIGFINNTNTTVKCNNTYATKESTPLRMYHCNAGTVSPAPQDVATADISSYLAYSKLSGFSFYKTSTNSGRWVTRRTESEDSTPGLKSFVESNEWFDASWYLDNTSALEYEISTLAELYAVAELPYVKCTNFGGKKINLTKDIVVNIGDSSKWSSVAPKNTWTPIGHSGMNFNGSFEGNGHTISGIYATGTSYVGLFGVTTVNSVIQNLRLENSYFGSSVSNLTDAYIGSIVGYGGGSLSNIYSDAIVYSTGKTCGGLIGRIDNGNTTMNKITNCWFNGELTGYQYVGGIVGIVHGVGTKVVIENCLVDGDITCMMNNAGGICGYICYGNTATTLEMANCLVTSKIRVGSPHCNNSVVGHAESSPKVKLTNVYTTNDVAHSDGTTVIQKQVDGIGNNSGSAVLQGDGKAFIKSNLLGAQARYNTILDFYLSETDDGIWVARKDKTPALKMFVPANEWYTEDEIIIADKSWYTNNTTAKEYIITTAAELYGLSEIVAAKTSGFASQTVKLGADILVNQGNAKTWGETAPINAWTPIGSEITRAFVGTFDGQGHTISGLYAKTSNSDVGLFGYTLNNAPLRNVRLVNTYFEQSSASAGYLGSILGYGGTGSIENVYSDAILVGAGQQIGGIVGRIQGNTDPTITIYPTYTMTNCWYDGMITSSNQYIGGIFGATVLSDVDMTNCLFTGTINSTYANSDSGARVGGLCAYPMNSSVVDITDSISAGRITDCCDGNTIGTVVGRLSSGNMDVNVTNVFAGYESGVSPFGSVDKDNTNINDILAQTVIRVDEDDRLIGFATEEDLTLDLSSYKNTWIVCEEGVPVPSVFADLVTKIETSDIDTILALTAMDNTWTYSSAVNKGLGHYVLTSTGKTYEDFTAYLTALTEQGFVPHVALNAADKDNVSSVIYKREAGEWVLNVVYSAVSKEVTLTISNGFDSLSDDLQPIENTTTGTVTMSMLKLTTSITNDEDDVTYQYGNSFVFKLPNGHFVINDGGALTDFNNLITHLKELANVSDDTTPIIIDAWTVTHQHSDHFDVIRGFLDNAPAREQIRVNAFYINEPNRQTALCEDSVDVYDSFYAQYKGLRLLKDENGKTPKVYWCQTGQTYYFDGLTMHIVQSQEQIALNEYADPSCYISEYRDYNTASTSMVFETSNGKKVYITGDMNYVNMEKIQTLYGPNSTVLSNIEIYQAPHHGKNTSMSLTAMDNTFSQMLINNRTTEEKKFDVVLFPASIIYGIECQDPGRWNGAKDANEYLMNEAQSKAYYDYEVTRKFELGDTITLLSNE